MTISNDLMMSNMSSDSTIDTITLTGSGTSSISNSGIYWGTGSSGIGSSGQVYTTNGTNTSWANISLADPDIKGSTLKVNGNADFDGEVTIKGKSLTEMFEKIEERLAILHPNPELEEKWDELKELGKRYKELEAEIIEKEKMWAILKK